MKNKMEGFNYNSISKKIKSERNGKVNSKAGAVAIVIISFILAVSIVCYSEFTQKYSLDAGEVSHFTIKAPKDIENRFATERLKQDAANKVDDVYERDENIATEIKSDFSEIFTKIRYIRTDENKSRDEKLEELQETIPFQLTLESYSAALDCTTQQLTDLEYQLLKILESKLEVGFKESEITSVKSDISNQVQKLKFSIYVRTLGEDIIFGVLKPNIVFNETLTEENKLEAMSKVNPVIIKADTVIIEKDTVITEEQVAILEDLDMLIANDNFTQMKVLGYILFIALLYVIVAAYLYYFKKKIFNSNRYILLINVIVIMTLLLAKLFYNINIYTVSISIIIAVMLIGVLIDYSMSIVLSIFISIILGLNFADNNIYIIIQGLLISVVGVLAINKTNQRSKMTNAGLILGAVGFCITAILQIIQGEVFIDIIKSGIISAISGFTAAICVIGLLPFFETWFGITTSFKLLELSNPNNPLLKKLMIEAPGTYHHSVVVANLAEAAVSAVGGNELLARAGSYYHDIGKMKRPVQFVENQLGGANPHNKYTPALSTLIISSHVKDGVEYARQYKLPTEIIDIIKQHHGDSLLQFFYHKAKELEPDKEIKEENFRYEGPKPQTREAAVIMLADSVEAATRAMGDPTRGKIESLVRKIIKSKLDDGQLDESNLTLRDLDLIARTFCKVLEGIYHSRIEYPSDEEIKKDKGKI